LTLLKEDFPGRQALLEQVSSLSVRPIDGERSLQLETSGPRAGVKESVPVEALLYDTDGHLIHVVLHVVDGLMRELEVHRDDFKWPQRGLSPADFRLIVY
jgi:hypothetical protein